MSSSIFSFESLRSVHPRAPVALLASLAIVIGLEIAIRIIPGEYFVHPANWVGTYYLTEQTIPPPTKPPQIVVFGTSRIGAALVEPTLEEELGLPPGACLNLAMRGCQPAEALRLYQDNRETLSQARLVVINLDEWNFSSGWSLNSRYRLLAPFETRLSFDLESVIPPLPSETFEARKARKRVQLQGLRKTLLLDWVSTLRTKLKPLRRATVARLKGWTPPPPLDRQERVRRLLADSGMEGGPDLFATMQFFYQDFDIHPALVNDLRLFVKSVQRDGVRVVLTLFPNRGAYQDLVEAHIPGSYDLFVRTARELADELGVPLYAWRRPGECNLRDANYGDYGHLSGQGGIAFSRFFSRLISEEHLLDR